jgi:hypothetical protein
LLAGWAPMSSRIVKVAEAIQIADQKSRPQRALFFR